MRIPTGRFDFDSCQGRTQVRILGYSICAVVVGHARSKYYTSVVRPSQLPHPQVGSRNVLTIFQRPALSTPTTRRRSCRWTSCGRIARACWPAEQSRLVTLPHYPHNTRLLSKGVRLTRCLPEIRDGRSRIQYPFRDEKWEISCASQI